MSSTAEPEPDAPGVSNILHLYADRFVRKASGRGPVVFSRTDTTVAVNREELAVTLIMAAIWSLREDGLIRIEQRQEKKLGLVKIKRTHLWPAADGEPRGDLERRILHQIRGPKKADSLTEYHLVRALVPLSDDAHNWVVGTVLNDDTEQGYLTKLYGGKSGKQLTGFEPAPDRIAALEPAAADLAQRWTAFREAEPDMVKPLASHIETALHGQARSDDDD